MLNPQSIQLIAKNLRGTVANKPDGREGMALAQYVTAMAYSNVGLGIAHSMAHTLGAVYDTPHGVACAMMLPIVMEFNKEYTGEKYKKIAEAFGVYSDRIEHSARRFRADLPPFQSNLSALLSTPFRKSSGYLSGYECNDRFSIPPESLFRAL